ncbi:MULTISPECIES: hypothetical protein [unclassified Pseudomonas]|uniref:hypothetical protein n=1 Tax=unclassified Pseudomonas TaxID=196821 RepID=UPI000A1EE518|nr:MULTISPECIES: hypothetical protein [unclassified Pseudomonas]
MTVEFDLLGPRDLGPIRAGMTRDDSRSALESPFDEFLKNPDSSIPTDAYVEAVYVDFTGVD